MNRKAIDYGVLERDVESNKQIYQSLLQRAKETGVSGELKTSNIRVVDAAERVDQCRSPRGRMLNLLVGIFGGLFCGVGCRLLLRVPGQPHQVAGGARGASRSPFDRSHSQADRRIRGAKTR